MQNADRAMALLEERYQPGLGTKAALALALDCCRALQEGQEQPADDEGAAKGGAAAAAAAAPALDVALITPEGVRLVERLSPPEALLSLAAADDGEDKEKGS